jgi:membrane-bound inhibitor of C-type lysozyme
MAPFQPDRRNRCPRLAAATLLTLLPLAAPPPPLRAETPIQVHYLCKGLFDASTVRALFFNQTPSEVVLLTGSEGATRLLQQRAASGARYADANESFWIKGEQATWQQGSSRAMQCEALKKETP